MDKFEDGIKYLVFFFRKFIFLVVFSAFLTSLTHLSSSLLTRNRRGIKVFGTGLLWKGFAGKLWLSCLLPSSFFISSCS